jgi:putative glycosyltransferase
MKLSIVATLYKSEEYIADFHRRISAVAEQLSGKSYELILVNDGSPDNSLALAVELANQDDHVKVIDLSRNFGHHKAMMTGLEQAIGEKIFLIDCDLEEPPECLTNFADQMLRDKCDVVYGIQIRRKGSLSERVSGALFYKIFQMATGMSLPENLITARLMTARYVKALLLHKEREVFLAGLWHITGFDQRPQAVKKVVVSPTTYTFRKKISLVVNSITSFSHAPLVGIFYIGILISTLSCAYLGYLIINWLFLSKPLSGWTSVMASIWLIGGMVISFIGVIGIYLSKIFTETKQRPYTIIRQIYSKDRNKGD